MLERRHVLKHMIFLPASVFVEEKKIPSAKRLINIAHILPASAILFTVLVSVLSPALRPCIALVVPWYTIIFRTYLLMHWKLDTNFHCDIGFVSHEPDDQSYKRYLQSNNRHAGGHFTLESSFENVGEEPPYNIIITYSSSNLPPQKTGGMAVIFSLGNWWKCISHSIFCSE